MKIVLGAAIGAALALGVLGASLSGGGDGGGDRLRVAHFANVGHAIPIVGFGEGFFERDLGGVALERRIFDNGPQAIESIFAGSVDLAYVGPGPAINGHLNSHQNSIRILAGAASGGASFVAHPDSGIAQASDLAGRRIAAPQIGNTQDVSLRSYIADNGLGVAERGGNVTVYSIPNPDIYTLFVKGEVDGAWVAEPWATILVRELGGERLFKEEELWPGGEFASVLLVADSGYVEQNPGIISRYLESHNAAAAWVNENPEPARDAFNSFLESYLGRPLPDVIVDEALSNITITSDPLPMSVHAFAAKADSLGYLGRGGYDLDKLFYPLDSNSGGAGSG